MITLKPMVNEPQGLLIQSGFHNLDGCEIASLNPTEPVPDTAESMLRADTR